MWQPELLSNFHLDYSVEPSEHALSNSVWHQLVVKAGQQVNT